MYIRNINIILEKSEEKY